MSKVQSYKKIFEKKLFFSYLRYSTQPGVYALVNEKEKKVYIQNSKNVIKSIVAAMPKFYKKDYKHFRINLIGYYPKEVLKAETHKAAQYYKSLGYTFYNKQPIYTPHTRLIHKYDMIRVQVLLVSAGKRVFPIRDFPTQDQADAFITLTSVYAMLLMMSTSTRAR